MNPYHQLVSEYTRLIQDGRNYPLGSFTKNSYPEPPAEAPNVLIFSPHPDDEVIIGGLPVRLLRQAKWKVIDVAVTLGSKMERRSERLAELKACCDYIGFQLVQAAPNGLEMVNLETRQNNPILWAQSTETIAQILANWNPKVIFFPHQADWNTTHIGTHFLVLDALKSLPLSFSCYTVETEFWVPMGSPDLMVEISEQDLGDLVTALSFHVGEVQRNMYHIALPAWMIDNVRRGSELLFKQGEFAANLTFATLYRVRKWINGQFQEVTAVNKVLGKNDDPTVLFQN